MSRLKVDDRGFVVPTVGFLQWRRFRDQHLTPNAEYFQRCRDFADGVGRKSHPKGVPVPNVNIIGEFADKFQAKMCGTRHHVSFVANMEDSDLTRLDQFYESQMQAVGDERVTALAVAEAVRVGTAFVVTAFDEDAQGIRGKYRGFLKRRVVRLEDMFFCDIHAEDVQDQAYVGYAEAMDLDAARALIDDEDEKRRKEKCRLVCRDDYEMTEAITDPSYVETDRDRCTVVTRFFRVGGEVWCETATKYVVLSLHPLNPDVTHAQLRRESEGYMEGGEGHLDEKDRKAPEYRGVDPARYLAHARPVRTSEGEYKKSKRRFSRYPISVYRPWPSPNLMWGSSKVATMMDNQLYINYVYLLVMLIIQNHGCPKYLVKNGALKGQVIDNSPSQILTDYSYIGGGQWGITRMGAGDSVNTSLIAVGEEMIRTTRSVFGFDNLSQNFTGDTSGYAYQMVTKQMDLTLEVPQMHLWDYFRQNAKTDLQFFQHYLGEKESFLLRKDDSEMMRQRSYMEQVKGMVQSGAVELPEGESLRLTRYQEQTIDGSVFEGDFDVNVEVMQGIEGSAITESQHFQQMFQLASSGNMRPDWTLAWLMADPQFSQKEKTVIKSMFETVQRGKIQELTDQIGQLKGALEQAMSKLQQMQGLNQLAQKQVMAVRKAGEEQSAAQNRMIRNLARAQPAPEDEGAVKSDNAKGGGGMSFAGQADSTVS